MTARTCATCRNGGVPRSMRAIPCNRCCVGSSEWEPNARQSDRLTAYHAGWRAGAIAEARAWQGDPAVEHEYRRGFRDGEKDRVRDSKRARARIVGGGR